MYGRSGTRAAARHDKRLRRDQRQDARQQIDKVAAAIKRSADFNVCFMNPARMEQAARRLARAALRGLH